jgi:hypothetical protein
VSGGASLDLWAIGPHPPTAGSILIGLVLLSTFPFYGQKPVSKLRTPSQILGSRSELSRRRGLMCTRPCSQDRYTNSSWANRARPTSSVNLILLIIITTRYVHIAMHVVNSRSGLTHVSMVAPYWTSLTMSVVGEPHARDMKHAHESLPCRNDTAALVGLLLGSPLRIQQLAWR